MGDQTQNRQATAKVADGGAEIKGGPGVLTLV
jgi:hypothetical protein